MSAGGKNRWKELWKTEDWLAVWAGFAIIILILSGLSLKMPSFRWTMEGELSTFIEKTTPALETLIAVAGEKGEKTLAAEAANLKAALDGKDRKAIAGAVRNVAESSRTVKDEALKNKAAALSKSVTTQVEALSGAALSGREHRRGSVSDAKAVIIRGSVAPLTQRGYRSRAMSVSVFRNFVNNLS